MWLFRRDTRDQESFDAIYLYIFKWVGLDSYHTENYKLTWCGATRDKFFLFHQLLLDGPYEEDFDDHEAVIIWRKDLVAKLHEASQTVYVEALWLKKQSTPKSSFS